VHSALASPKVRWALFRGIAYEHEGSGGCIGGIGGGGTTVNDPEPARPVIEKVCCQPCQTAPFHPSPKESIMSSVQSAPSETVTGEPESYGAPPPSAVPSLQVKVQPTS